MIMEIILNICVGCSDLFYLYNVLIKEKFIKFQKKIVPKNVKFGTTASKM